MGQRVGTAPQAFHNDSPNTAVHDRVAPEPGDIIVRKVRVGAFSTTDLDAQLRERDIDTLILAGISTSGVVLSTVRDAHDRDYRVVVLADATADPDAEVHAFLTERIFPRQADVITVAELEGLLHGRLTCHSVAPGASATLTASQGKRASTRRVPKARSPHPRV